MTRAGNFVMADCESVVRRRDSKQIFESNVGRNARLAGWSEAQTPKILFHELGWLVFPKKGEHIKQL